MWNRAAQFAPFAALTGYDAAIQESGFPLIYTVHEESDHVDDSEVDENYM